MKYSVFNQETTETPEMDKSKKDLPKVKKPPLLVQRAQAKLNSAVIRGESETTLILLREQLARAKDETGYKGD
jgi:hypothetical protein